MPVRFRHDQQSHSIWFSIFTCWKWLSLIQETNSYYAAYKCPPVPVRTGFDSLSEKNVYVTGYVIMPNHVHALLYFPRMPKSINTVIGNAKRFLAYEIVKRLQGKKANELLELLYGAVKKSERKKGQRHKVFEDSFDAKECYSTEFIFQKLHYMHHNPVNKRWQLVNDFAEYEYSSASFYEKRIKKYLEANAHK